MHSYISREDLNGGEYNYSVLTCAHTHIMYVVGRARCEYAGANTIFEVDEKINYKMSTPDIITDNTIFVVLSLCFSRERSTLQDRGPRTRGPEEFVCLS